jgi:ribosomal-protein-alanine N-acetyltransferase
MELQTIFKSLPIINTKRLRLRPLSLDDAADMFEYSSDPEVTQYVSWEAHQSIEDAVIFLNTSVEQYAKAEPGTWGIELREEAKLIGTIGFVYYSAANSRIEIGYAISRKYWGRGITTEALTALIELAFRQWNINRIEAHCFPDNHASARVMEKCGLRYEGLLRQRYFLKNAFRDLKLYAILKEDWLVNHILG